jgi:hypothetical protein
MNEQIGITLLLYVHLVTMAWGVAGTTIANLMIRFEHEPWFSFLRIQQGPWLPSTLFPRLTRLITLSVILLGLSGIGLAYLRGGETLDLKVFTIKLILVGIVFVNGIELALKLEPELEKTVPANPGEPETPEFQRLMARVRLHGLISLTGWYLIVALSLFVRR